MGCMHILTVRVYYYRVLLDVDICSQMTQFLFYQGEIQEVDAHLFLKRQEQKKSNNHDHYNKLCPLTTITSCQFLL